MTKIFGANWKTTVSQAGVAIFSLLTLLAALPYQLGEIATIIPPEWKSKVVAVGAFATLVLRLINGWQQKSKDVTGGTVQQTADNSVAVTQSTDAVVATTLANPK